MTAPPDEIRADFEVALSDGIKLSLSDNGCFIVVPEGMRIQRLTEREEEFVRAAYASGSAARKERDVRIVREERAKWDTGGWTEEYQQAGREIADDIIERIEKE